MEEFESETFGIKICFGLQLQTNLMRILPSHRSVRSIIFAIQASFSTTDFGLASPRNILNYPYRRLKPDLKNFPLDTFYSISF